MMPLAMRLPSATDGGWSVLAARLYTSLSAERHLIGSALLRVALALVLLYQLLTQWEQRLLLWGPHGLYPLWLFERLESSVGTPSLFAVSSETELTGLYVVAIVVSVLYLVGWHARWAGILFYAFAWSLFMRNPLTLNGGDNLVWVEMPFVLLLNTSAYFSADSHWRLPGQPVSEPHPTVALIHNVAVFCVLVQLSIVYGMSGVFKAMGPLWQDGTAAYYALRANQFRLPGLGPLIYQNPWLVSAATHSTVAFEILYPLLIWSRKTRWMAVSMTVLFHVSIAVFLGLVLFSAEMLCFQVLVLGDESYQYGYRLWTRAGRLLSDRVVMRSFSPPASRPST